ncbi:MAG: hypothetical protein AAB414_02555 [Patescibacteria group bacterium]
MNSATKKLIFSIFVVFLIICQPLAIGAAEESISLKNEAINPGSFYYSFKRLWEKGLGKLQFSRQSKINFYQSQLKIKLSELNFVVEKKLLSEVQQASERFAFHAGILTDELIKQNSKDKEKTIKEFEVYGKFLEKLRDVYPANTSFWMLIQHDINTLKILSERLK